MDINIPENAELQILVENMGRINYGSEIIHNTKGIISPLTIDNKEITGNWQMRSLPMSEEPNLTKPNLIIPKELRQFIKVLLIWIKRGILF